MTFDKNRTSAGFKKFGKKKTAGRSVGKAPREIKVRKKRNSIIDIKSWCVLRPQSILTTQLCAVIQSELALVCADDPISSNLQSSKIVPEAQFFSPKGILVTRLLPCLVQTRNAAERTRLRNTWKGHAIEHTILIA